MPGLTLYTYFRSSAAYRVRIALNLKGLVYTPHYVHLLRDGGEQHSPAYRRINPQGLVPALEVGGRVLTQSLAIIEYLEECHPQPALLPETPEGRAVVRALAQIISCDIHPLDNLRVLDYLRQHLAMDEAARRDWYRHWITEGLDAFEKHLVALPGGTGYCFGDQPTMADICLIPQLFNARRYDCDLSPYPRIQVIESHCMGLPLFCSAAPENQGDSE